MTGRTPATIRPPTRRSSRRPRASRARSCATKAMPRRRSAPLRRRCRRNTTSPHLAHAPMEPPCATGARRRRQMRGLGAGAEPGRHAQRAGREARPQAGGRDGQRHACSAAASAASRNATSCSKRHCCRARWAARRSRSSGRARTTSITTIYTPSRPSASMPGSTRRASVVAWRHRSVAPTIRATFVPDPKHEQPGELGHGVPRRAVRHPQPALRERRGRGAYAHRLVPLGVEHPACLRDSVLCRRARPCGGARPQGHADRADRAAAHRRSRHRAKRRYRITATRSRPTRSTRRGCGASSSSSPTRRSGARNCRRATAKASPCIAAS